MRRHTAFYLTILICMLGGTISALAFTFITFDPPGSVFTQASSINNQGQIVGFFSDSSGEGHGFLRNKDGTFTTIDPPGSVFTQALSINNPGEVVGVFEDSSFVGHGFLTVP
jgi:probable HAF family extracellular repeat protein